MNKLLVDVNVCGCGWNKNKKVRLFYPFILRFN